MASEQAARAPGNICRWSPLTESLVKLVRVHPLSKFRDDETSLSRRSNAGREAWSLERQENDRERYRNTEA